MKKGMKICAIIMAVTCFVIGATTLEVASVKVLQTARKLFVLRDNMNFYNEQQIKTNAMTTELVAQTITARHELNTSDDFVVSTFANANALAKIACIVAALAIAIGIPIYLLYLSVETKRKNEEEKFRRWRDRKLRERYDELEEFKELLGEI